MCIYLTYSLVDALSNPEAAAKPVSSAAQSTAGKMTKEEAMKILNITKDASRKDMINSFERLFKANESSKGGSHYLQSKVLRAREALEDVYKE